MSDERPLVPETPRIPGDNPSSPAPPARQVPGPSEHPSSPALLPSERGEGSRDREPVAPSPGSTGQGVRSEGETWRGAMPALGDRLREIGYDIASSPSGAPPGDSIVTRRDLGDRAVVLAIDAGGRFRAEITWIVGEWPSRDEVAGVPVQVVDAVSRAVTVTGQMAGPEQVLQVVTGLGAIASWAGVAKSEAPPPPT
jgi:hypothetical protein